MTKADLKTGMIVEHKSGLLGIWISGTSISYNDGGISSNMLNDDLSSNSETRHNIIKVYSIPDERQHYNESFKFWLDDKHILKYCDLLWEIPEVIEEMTMAEICNALCKNIKIKK